MDENKNKKVNPKKVMLEILSYVVIIVLVILFKTFIA